MQSQSCMTRCDVSLTVLHNYRLEAAFLFGTKPISQTSQKVSCFVVLQVSVLSPLDSLGFPPGLPMHFTINYDQLALFLLKKIMMLPPSCCAVWQWCVQVLSVCICFTKLDMWRFMAFLQHWFSPGQSSSQTKLAIRVSTTNSCPVHRFFLLAPPQLFLFWIFSLEQFMSTAWGNAVKLGHAFDLSATLSSMLPSMFLGPHDAVCFASGPF